jgi:hypothetical protein
MARCGGVAQTPSGASLLTWKTTCMRLRFQMIHPYQYLKESQTIDRKLSHSRRLLWERVLTLGIDCELFANELFANESGPAATRVLEITLRRLEPMIESLFNQPRAGDIRRADAGIQWWWAPR